MHCPLCGCEFDETDHSCTTECPWPRSRDATDLLPNCGYQMVDEKKSGIARLLRRLTHSSADPTSRSRPRERTVPLHRLKSGQRPR